MADYIITGRIYLTSGIADEELTDISYFSWDRAAKNRLGINMYNNLAGAQAVYKYPQRNCFKDGFIPFEIVDSPWSCECDRIFGGILYEDKTFRIADISSSGLPDVEKFLISASTHEKIS